MKSERGSAGVWIGVAVVFVVLVCLCLAAVACGAGVFLFQDSDQEFQVTPDFSFELDGYDSSSDPEVTESAPISAPEVAPVESAAHEMLQILSNTSVPEADPIELAERFYGLEDIPTVLVENAEQVPAGAIKSFWVTNMDTDTNFQIDAEMVYAREHVYFWIEKGVDYRMSDVRALIDEFEDKIYPTVREFFGSEWTPGVDGDPGLYILYARGMGWSVAGYYASIDEYSPLVHEYSNGHEMFYLSADNVRLDEEFTYGVLAHEFQHMIHWYRDPNEDTWVNEGFSELASFLNDYDPGGFDYVYVSNPDIPLAYWPGEPGTAGGHYGQAFMVMTYFLDRFGSEATIAVVDHPGKGIAAINEVFSDLGVADPVSGAMVRFDDFYEDFAVALLLQDTRVLDGRYGYSNYPSAPAVYPTDGLPGCPVSSFVRDVNQYGIDYIGIPCEGAIEIAFSGSTLTRVVPEDPYSGEYAFWSNRGDVSNPTLQRSFDLTSVSEPVILEFKTWYDLEESYDYLYLQVSDDSGESWSIITTPSGTEENPSGNSYGWAYNGFSGGGQKADWIHEEVDLSEYAGREIQVLFEYVTDAAVNGEGFLLDDVRIDAIDYFEDFEEGDGGWQGDGFVRLYNRIPQTYRVLLVQEGRDVQFHEMELDADQQGALSINLSTTDDATLIVIGTSQFSIQPSGYEISVINR